jgi:hypothetical protein
MGDDKDLSTSTDTSAASGGLLNELGSIKELLDEELGRERAAPVTSIEQIGSVEEYLRIKQAADSAGLSISAYMEQEEATQNEAELELLEGDDENIPTLDEVVGLDEAEHDGYSLLREVADEEERAPATTVEEYFAAVAAAKRGGEDTSMAVPSAPQAAPHPVDVVPPPPLLDEAANTDDDVPLLEEVASEAGPATTGGGVSMDEMQDLVDLIVNRKLQQLKPELEKEVMAELQKVLPISALTNT